MEKCSKGVKEVVIATDPPPRHLCPHQRQSPDPSGLGMMVLESLSVTHYFHSSQRPFSLLGLCWSIMVQ